MLKDDEKDVGSRNERHLCAVNYSKSPGFEVLHGLLDRVMQLLEVPFDSDGGHCGYHLKPIEGFFSYLTISIMTVNAFYFIAQSIFLDDTYFSGRTAEIIFEGKPIGVLGVLHPEVVTNFELNMPCSAFEISIEPFL